MTRRSSKRAWMYRGGPVLHVESHYADGAAMVQALDCTPGRPPLTDRQQALLLQCDTLTDAIGLATHLKLLTSVAPVTDLRKALRAGPVIAEVPWPASWDQTTGDGWLCVVTDALPPDPPMHSVCVVGYDERRGAYRLLESRGPGWGQLGRAWVSCETFEGLVALGRAVQVRA